MAVGIGLIGSGVIAGGVGAGSGVERGGEGCTTGGTAGGTTTSAGAVCTGGAGVLGLPVSVPQPLIIVTMAAITLINK